MSYSSLTEIVVRGYGGNDTIRCDSESWTGQHGIFKDITAYGGDGNDYIRLSYGDDKIYGGIGNDTLYGRYGDDIINGNEGNDKLDAWYGDDTLYGGADNDILYGGYDDDDLYGGSGHDKLYGGAGNDYLYGGSGNDWLLGHAGVDRLYGNDGQDYLNGGLGDDIVSGGDGIDTYRRSLNAAGFNLTEDDEDETADVPVEVSGAFLSDKNPPTRDSHFHVDQTRSETCSFLAALAAVADWTGDYPQFGSYNKDLISLIKYDSSSAKYGVRLFVAGKWNTYWVTGDWTEYYDPSGPLWVTLYQKAFLQAMNVATKYSDGTPIAPKYWKSSTGANWQNPGIALKALTHYPIHWVGNGSMSASSMRRDLIDNGAIMVASSYDNANNSAIPANHAFHVDSVYHDSSKGWMVRLYNPWGHDTKTTGISQYGDDDGLILITWSAFKKNFEGYHWV